MPTFTARCSLAKAKIHSLMQTIRQILQLSSLPVVMNDIRSFTSNELQSWLIGALDKRHNDLNAAVSVL